MKKIIAIDVREAIGEKTGKGWYVMHVVKAMLAIDHETHFVLFTHKSIPFFEKYKNVEQRVMSGHGILWHIRVCRSLIVLAKDYNIVFFAPTSFIISSFLPKKIRTVITVHDMVAFLFSSHHNKKAIILERIFLPIALRKIHAVITVSYSTKHDLIKLFPQIAPKVHVIYNAADQPAAVSENDRTTLRQKFSLPKQIILDIGTLEPRKNHSRVLRAFAAIAAKFPQYHLVIAGGKGWHYQDVFKTHAALIAAQPDLKERIHFLGYVSMEDLQILYTMADVFVFPALYEGFGLPAVEALSYGCPVIVPNNSSLPEVVGDAGLLVNPYSEAEISAAMERILGDRAFANTLRAKGKTQSQKFSWEKAGEQILAILKNYINNT